MADFTEQEIEVRYDTDLWGPYLFSFPACSSATANDGTIPFGATIQTVNVRAFIGNVKSSSNLASFATVTSALIDPSYTPIVVDNTDVSVKFQYPGNTYRNNKVTLIFELTLSTGAKHPFYFQYLRIRGEE